MATVPLLSPVSTSFGPRPIRWTCEEFHCFGEMGVLEGRRALLMDGVILELGPMNPPQAITLGLVEEALRTVFGRGWWLRIQMPLILGQHTDPEPDLAVVLGRPRDHATHPTTAELLVEVADSSLRFDTTEKGSLYAAAGIREYWVVDANGRQLLVYRDPHASPGQPYGHDYATVQTLGPAESVVPLAASGAVVRVVELLI